MATTATKPKTTDSDAPVIDTPEAAEINGAINALKNQTKKLDDKITSVKQHVDKRMDDVLSAIRQRNKDEDKVEKDTKSTVKDAVKEGLEEEAEETKKSVIRRAGNFGKHFVPVNKKEAGQLVVGFGLGYFVGGQTGGAIPGA